MTRRVAGLAAGAAAVVALAGAAAHPTHGGVAAYPYGPPPARTGGFGEPSCHVCHFDNAANEPGGTLSIAGVPASWTAGQRYRLTVAVRQGDLQAGGFQLASRFANAPNAGARAGTLRSLDERTQVPPAPGGAIQYASHARPGVAPSGDGRIEWAIEWTAPATAGGPVVFHASALSGNGDGSPLGDRVYTTSVVARSAKP